MFAPRRNSKRLRALRRLRPAVVLAVTTAMTVGLVAGPSFATTKAPGVKTVWRPRALVTEPSIPGVKKTGHPAALPAPLPTAKPVAAVFPSAASVTVTLSGSSASRAAGTPWQVGQDPAADAAAGTGATPDATTASKATKITITVVDPKITAKAGIPGTIVTVTRADGSALAANVKVSLDYTAFMDAYGGYFGNRLTLVELPDCVLTNPGSASCRRQTKLKFTNTDTTTVHTLAAAVTIPAKTTTKTGATTTTKSSGVLVLAAASSPQSSNGSYSATSLKESDTWNVSNTGGFDYVYPVTTPPGLGAGTSIAPSLALDYTSDTEDGKTPLTNPQGSIVGDGWTDTSPGFIEKTFTACAQVVGAPASWKNTGDNCVGTPGVTLSMPGASGALVYDDTNHYWRIQGDDGSEVQELTGASNGDPADNNAYWLVTTANGTKYYFGANRLPGGSGTDTPTYSAWGEPVFGAGSTCTDPTSTTQDPNACRAAYRWNLDFVIDPHNNVTRYSYLREFNFYTHAATGTLAQYTSGGYLSEIDYGMQAADVTSGALPAAEVIYNLLPRCTVSLSNASCPTTVTYPNSGLVSAGITTGTTGNSAVFQDVPADELCGSTGACANYSPSFFQTARLGSITTAVHATSGSTPGVSGVTGVNPGFIPVDQYTLNQAFISPDSGASLALGSISQTGYTDGQTTQNIPGAPDTQFTYSFMPNRATISPLYASQGGAYTARLTAINDALGGDIRVTYDSGAAFIDPCTTAPQIDANHTMCYPELWLQPGNTNPTADWMNKYVVTSVQTDDMTTLSGAMPTGSSSVHTDYVYDGTPAWHSNDSEQTPQAYRTFDQFRGFGQVDTITGGQLTGTAPNTTIDNSQNTKSTAYYMRGMDQDPMLSGAPGPAVSVTDTRGDSFVDDNIFAGVLLETETFTSADPSATPYTETIDYPAESAPTAQHTRINNLPIERARFTQTSEKVVYQAISTGTRRTETDYTYDDTPPMTNGVSTGNGRLLQTWNKTDGALPQNCSTNSYAYNLSNPQWTSYVAQVKTQSQPAGSTSCLPLGTAGVYDQGGIQSIYDNQPSTQITKGDVTATLVVNKINADGSENWITKFSTPVTDFDPYGRASDTTDALGRESWTDYTPAYAAGSNYLPTAVTTTAPEANGAATTRGWSTTTHFDQGRDLAISSTDQNGATTTTAYDGLGRTTAVWQPGRALSDTPNTQFSYHVAGTGTAPAPSYTLTQKLREDGTYSSAYTIIDGLGRIVQTQTTPGDNSNGQVVTDQTYDYLGRALVSTAAHYDATVNPSGTWLLYADASMPSQTRIAYDGMSRQISSTELNKTVPLWSTSIAYDGADRTDTIPPPGGTATTVITDALGRTTQVWQYDNSPSTPTGVAANAQITNYTYGFVASGTTTTVTDPTGSNNWSTTDDLLGHTISQADPNSGTTTTSFDADGEALSTTVARGAQISYVYDNLGRKAAEYDTTGGAQPAASNQIAAWTYDATPINGGSAALGQPTTATEYVGGSGSTGQAYTSSVTGYDANYRITGSQVQIPTTGPNAALGGTYATQNVYTPITGLLDHTTQPAVPAANMAAETVYNSYNPNGLLMTSGGNADYLVDTQYNPYGDVTSRTLGDYPYQVAQQTLYDPATGRVLKTFVDTSAGQNPANPLQLVSTGVDYTTYTYNAVGQITSVNDQQNYNGTNPSTDLQCYLYDPLGQLKTAWTDNGTTNPGPTDLIDDSGNTGTGPRPGGVGGCATTGSAGTTGPTLANVTNAGPAPYWQDFSNGTIGLATDAMGNRVTVTNHAVVAGGTDIVQNYTPTGGPGATNTATTPGVGPHLLGSVTASGGATGTDTYTYDQSGDTLTRNIAAETGQAAAHETLTWNDQGQLSTDADTASGTTSAYVYDASGAQLIRSDTTAGVTTSTLYLGGTQIQYTSSTKATTAQRYYSFADAPTTVVSSNGTITVEVTNDQGTGGATINATPGAPGEGTVVARRYAKPYGEARGTGLSTTFGTFPDDHTFLGKTTDAGTGLVDDGARKYDPSTGRFISIDPDFEADDPQQIGGYAYAGNDPVSASDPTGLVKIGPDGGSSKPTPDDGSASFKFALNEIYEEYMDSKLFYNPDNPFSPIKKTGFGAQNFTAVVSQVEVEGSDVPKTIVFISEAGLDQSMETALKDAGITVITAEPSGIPRSEPNPLKWGHAETEAADFRANIPDQIARLGGKITKVLNAIVSNQVCSDTCAENLTKYIDDPKVAITKDSYGYDDDNVLTPKYVDSKMKTWVTEVGGGRFGTIARFEGALGVISDLALPAQMALHAYRGDLDGFMMNLDCSMNPNQLMCQPKPVDG